MYEGVVEIDDVNCDNEMVGEVVVVECSNVDNRTRVLVVVTVPT